MVQLWVTANELYNPALAYAEEAARTATSVLYALSGRKFPGATSVTEIYRCENRGIGWNCNSTPAARELKLRGTPVRSITEMRIGTDRRLVPATEYRLYDRKWLRPQGSASWHPCGMLEITYVYGLRPPQMGRRAARTLANEFLKASVNADDCQLPDRVTSVSRQGISFSILDPQDFLTDGRTGLYEVDLFLAASNPDKARAKARVFIAGGSHGRTVTRVATTVALSAPLTAATDSPVESSSELQSLLSQRDALKKEAGS